MSGLTPFLRDNAVHLTREGSIMSDGTNNAKVWLSDDLAMILIGSPDQYGDILPYSHRDLATSSFCEQYSLQTLYLKDLISVTTSEDNERAMTLVFSRQSRMFITKSVHERNMWMSILPRLKGVSNQEALHKSSASVANRNLERDCKRIDEFPRLEGSGDLAVMSRACLPGGREVSVCFVEQSSLSVPVTQIKQEVEYMAMFTHPNLCSYLACFGPDGRGRVWVTSEFCVYGSVLHMMKHSRTAINENQIAYICHSVLTALSYLHENNVPHGGVRGCNLRVAASGKVKLAPMLPRQKWNTSQSGDDYHWYSPELVRDGTNTKKSDIWALGITCLELANGGRVLESSRSAGEVKNDLLNQPPPSIAGLQGSFSSGFGSFIAKCLATDPYDRADPRELLSDPFITDNITSQQENPLKELVWKMQRDWYTTFQETVEYKSKVPELKQASSRLQEVDLTPQEPTESGSSDFAQQNVPPHVAARLEAEGKKETSRKEDINKMADSLLPDNKVESEEYTGSSTLSQRFFQSIVGEPFISGGFFDEHTRYPIKIKEKQGITLPQPLIISRRYSDFLRLYEALIASYPHSLVPPIPERTVAALLDEEVIDHRQRELQWFLNALCKHKSLGATNEVNRFLTAGDDSAILGTDLRSMHPPEEKIPVGETVSDMWSSFTSAFGGDDGPMVPTNRDEEELALVKSLLTYAGKSKVNLASVCECAKNIAETTGEVSMAWFDMPYEQRDSEVTVMGVEMSRLMRSCVLMARAVRKEKDMLDTQLWGPLHYYTRSSQTLMDLFRRHEAAIKSVQRLKREKPPLPESFIEEKRTKLDQQREKMLDECEDYQTNKLKDFQMLVKNLAITNVEAEKRKQATWNLILHQLERGDPLPDGYQFLPREKN